MGKQLIDELVPYILLADESSLTLQVRVNEAIERGYKPLAGVACTAVISGPYVRFMFAQSMIKREAAEIL